MTCPLGVLAGAFEYMAFVERKSGAWMRGVLFSGNVMVNLDHIMK
jgi:hypothetical protein